MNLLPNIVLTNVLTKNMIDIQTFTKFCHLLSYKYNASHLDDSGIKICITKIISVLLQQLCQEAQINSFQLNGHKNDFKITASDKEKKTYLTLLTLFLNFAINLFYISLSFWQPCPTKILGKNITLPSCPISLAFGFR